MAWGKKPRQYEPGGIFSDYIDVIRAIEDDGYLFWRGSVMHTAVIRNWSVESIRNITRGGQFRQALLTDYGRRVKANRETGVVF